MQSDRTTDNAIRRASELFAKYGSFIKAAIRFQTRNESEEDDLYQQFFISLVQRPVPPHTPDVRAYLYRAIANDIVSAARQRKRSQRHLKKLGEELRVSAHEPDSVDIPAELEGQEALLSSRETDALALHFGDNLTVSETASRMHVDEHTVRAYVAAALVRLRERIREMDAREEPPPADTEKLLLILYAHGGVPDQVIADRVVDLCRALNQCHVLSGGNGLTIDDWQTLHSADEPVRQLR